MLSLGIRYKRLKLRIKVWRKKREGFFDWKPFHKLPFRMKKSKRLRKTGLVQKKYKDGEYFYRININAYRQMFGLGG